jgi:hypothetical protein
MVYANRPFAGPAQVLDYVGRYTHRVAISNHRLIDMEDGRVRFRYKDYRAEHPDHPTTMTLAGPEFIRRFLLHVLPPGFDRIRYYGSSAIVTGATRSIDAVICSALRRHPNPSNPRPLTFAIGTRRSPVSRCARARSVSTAG